MKDSCSKLFSCIGVELRWFKSGETKEDNTAVFILSDSISILSSDGYSEFIVFKTPKSYKSFAGVIGWKGVCNDGGLLCKDLFASFSYLLLL